MMLLLVVVSTVAITLLLMSWRRQRALATACRVLWQVTVKHWLPSATQVGDALRIPYRYEGQQYVVHVPYNMHHIAHLANCYVSLIPSKGPPIDITQQAGVPYLCSATDLCAQHIMVETGDGDRYSYKGDTTPHYLANPTTDTVFAH